MSDFNYKQRKNTKEYEEGYTRIFGKKKKKAKSNRNSKQKGDK